MVPRTLLPLAVATAGLALAPPASATFPGHNGRIAFHALTDSGVQIFSVRPNGKDLRQLTRVAGADARLPDWSPDGRLIAFSLETEQSSSVAIMNADGSDVDVLPHPDGVFDGDPSFTPDGQRLVVDSFDGIVEAMVSMNLDGTDRQQVTTAGGPDPNVSPDGRSLAFQGFNGEEFGAALFTVGITGDDLRQLMPFTADVGSKLDWAPDGDRLAFITDADHPGGESANIATIRADGTDLRLLTHYTGGEISALVGSYSPDGHWIAYRLEDHGRYGLYRIHPDGRGAQAILPLSDFAPRFIDWGPRVTDGRSGETR